MARPASPHSEARQGPSWGDTARLPVGKGRLQGARWIQCGAACLERALRPLPRTVPDYVSQRPSRSTPCCMLGHGAWGSGPVSSSSLTPSRDPSIGGPLGASAALREAEEGKRWEGCTHTSQCVSVLESVHAHMRVGLHAHMRVGVCACAHACQGLCAHTGTSTAEHTMYPGSVVAHIRVGVCAHMRVRLCCRLRAPAAQCARRRLGPGCACALASMGGGTECVTQLRGSTRLTRRPCPRNCDTGARERHWGQWGACWVRVCTSDATAASPPVRAGEIGAQGSQGRRALSF